MNQIINKKWIAFLCCCLFLLAMVGCATDTATDTQGNDDTVTGPVTLGQTMEYEIGDIYLSEKLLPEDTSGFYKYYEASEGNTFFIVEMDITNVSNDQNLVWSLGEATLTVDGKTYEADIAVKIDGQTDSFGNGNIEISAGQSHHVYYLFDVPTESAGKEAVLTMTSNDQSQSHNIKAG